MPLPAELLEDMAAKFRAAETRARWDTRFDLFLTALACIVISALGILSIGYSLHTTNPWIGRAFFWGGLGIGNGGIIFTLLAAYRRGERRGDW